MISHAHGDHIGGAQMLQERYGAKVVMGAAAWDLVETYPKGYTSMAPWRDIVATDGMQITLGDTAITVWETPGHTPGTLSYTFTVFDQGRPVHVAYLGSIAFNVVNNTRIRASRSSRRISSHNGTSPSKRPRPEHRAPLQLFGVRQCRQPESDACWAGRRSPPLRAR